MNKKTMVPLPNRFSFYTNDLEKYGSDKHVSTVGDGFFDERKCKEYVYSFKNEYTGPHIYLNNGDGLSFSY